MATRWCGVRSRQTRISRCLCIFQGQSAARIGTQREVGALRIIHKPTTRRHRYATSKEGLHLPEGALRLHDIYATLRPLRTRAKVTFVVDFASHETRLDALERDHRMLQAAMRPHGCAGLAQYACVKDTSAEATSVRGRSVPLFSRLSTIFCSSLAQPAPLPVPVLPSPQMQVHAEQEAEVLLAEYRGACATSYFVSGMELETFLRKVCLSTALFPLGSRQPPRDVVVTPVDRSRDFHARIYTVSHDEDTR